MPNLAPDVIPIADLRGRLADTIREVRHSRRAVVVTQRGRAVAVVMDWEEYRRITDKEAIGQILDQGERDIAAGRGIPAEEVFTKAKAIISGKRA